MSDKTVPRVVATPAALALIRDLEARHGPLMFYQSVGCCDGSAPLCFQRGDFKLGDRDRLMGHIGDQPFYMTQDQAELWSHTQLMIDVTTGRGGGFSLESPDGVRFLTRSRLFGDDETPTPI